MARCRNGVAIASRVGVADVVTNFGLGPVGGGEVEEGAPAHEARMIAATCGGVRVVSLYAPNGRALDTPFYEAKLAWFRGCAPGSTGAGSGRPLILGGDLNVAPTDLDVYDPAAYVGTTHTSRRLSGPPSSRSSIGGSKDTYRRFHPEPGRFTWWDYRAGNFHNGLGMRIDHLLRHTCRWPSGRSSRDRPRRPEGKAAFRPRSALRRPAMTDEPERPAPEAVLEVAARATSPQRRSRSRPTGTGRSSRADDAG